MSSAKARFLVLPSLVLAPLGVLAGIVLFLFDPSHSGFYPVCHFHQFTGLLCPGCGSLRAVHQLLHGHLTTALHYNGFLVISLPLLAWFAMRYALRVSRNQPVTDMIRPAWLYFALALLLVFSILRNLPLAQLAWLAPPP